MWNAPWAEPTLQSGESNWGTMKSLNKVECTFFTHHFTKTFIKSSERFFDQFRVLETPFWAHVKCKMARAYSTKWLESLGYHERPLEGRVHILYTPLHYNVPKIIRACSWQIWGARNSILGSCEMQYGQSILYKVVRVIEVPWKAWTR